VNVLVYTNQPGVLPQQILWPTLPMALFAETPEQIRSEIKVGKLNSFKSVRKAQLSIQEILEYRRLHPGGTNKDDMLDTKLHGRLAAPWTCLVVVLIALPFGAAAGRRNVAVGVASSIVICFAYFVLLQLALALGTSGRVEPWVAAWSPNALFALVGLVLTWRVR
jgi:lipopolysaccharide export LptBFGC system permease protein LptF